MALAGCGGSSHTSSTAAADANGAPVQGVTTTGSTTPASGAPGAPGTANTATTTAPAGRTQAPGAGGGGASGGASQGSPNAATPANGGSTGAKTTTHRHAHRAARRTGSNSGLATSGSGSGASGGPGSSTASKGVPFEVSTTSMEPTYKPETTVYYDPTRIHPQIGDVVLFHLPAGAEGGSCAEVPVGGAPCRDPVPGLLQKVGMKRIVGLPGDTIAIREGHVIRNGQPEPEPPTQPCGKVEQWACEYPKAITVPDGHYYVMSDYRAGAKEDSRIFGAVPQEAIIGTVEGS